MEIQIKNYKGISSIKATASVTSQYFTSFATNYFPLLVLLRCPSYLGFLCIIRPIRYFVWVLSCIVSLFIFILKIRSWFLFVCILFYFRLSLQDHLNTFFLFLLNPRLYFFKIVMPFDLSIGRLVVYSFLWCFQCCSYS